MKTRWLLTLCVLLAAAPAHAVVPTVEQPYAVLRALDKITARVEEIELPVGKVMQFGNLAIVARTCRVTLPEETPPESAAYLEVSEFKPGATSATPVFDGWMFASSPALSAMEHPVYDIWVTGCKDKDGDKAGKAEPPAAVPAAAPPAPAPAKTR